ncbi:hypothetical protein G6F68_019177 [Rhizopus microsporus]|nr:hypothetical protein G6F68_019177 [Rhizopus microsporus]KAG1378577.1 hypothetical protein G6F59_018098 [Rhizopus arrhizus]
MAGTAMPSRCAGSKRQRLSTCWRAAWSRLREPLLRSMLTATGWPLLSTSTRSSTVPCSWLRSAGTG